ncbi:MAG: transposase [Oceanobacillus sp.]|nr:transposase [Oceanobacillus sp.]
MCTFQPKDLYFPHGGKPLLRWRSGARAGVPGPGFDPVGHVLEPGGGCIQWPLRDNWLPPARCLRWADRRFPQGGTAPGECVRGLRGPGELVFHHEYVVTNLAESVPAEWVFQTYQQRGTMENYIKVEKHGFFLDKTDSSGFRENQARMMVSLLAYNIVNFLHTLCLSGQEGRIGRAKGVETYFAFNPFCEKKKRKTGTMEWPFHQFPLLRWTTEKGLSPSTIFTDA